MMRSIWVIVSLLMLTTCVTFAHESGHRKMESKGIAAPVAPKPTEALPQNTQAYEIGVWSFVLFAVMVAYGFWALASTDYSDESLINIDPDEYREHRD